MFNINFNYIIHIVLPVYLRFEKQISWLKVITSYINKIYLEFSEFRSLNLYDINFTGQVMYLEKKLQDEFYCSGLYISDGTTNLPFYLYNKSEGELPVYFYNKSEEELPVYLFNKNEFTEQADFFINIPIACYSNFTADDINKLHSIVQYYKNFDKNYNIKIVKNYG